LEEKMTDPEEFEYKNDLHKEFGGDIRLIFERRASLIERLDATRGKFHELKNKAGVIEGKAKVIQYLDTLTSEAMGYLGVVFEESPFARLFNEDLIALITQYLKDPSKVDKKNLTAVTETVEWMKNIAGLDLETMYKDAQRDEELNVLELQQALGQAQEGAEGYNMRAGAVALQNRATTKEALGGLEADLRAFHPGLKTVVGPQDLGRGYYGKLAKEARDYDGAKPYLKA